MSSNEKNIPKRRFKEFLKGEAWEECKLRELGSLKNGMNFSKDAMDKGYPFVNLQNIFGKNVIDIKDLGKAEASRQQLKEYSLLKGDVLFVRSSVKLEGVGEAALVPESLINTTYSGFIIRFRDEIGMDNNFKRYIFSTKIIREQIMANATNSANKNISQPVLSNLTFHLPCYEEQNKIGDYFSELDDLITLNKRKLDKLKVLKKAYLAQMFPSVGESKPRLRFSGFNDEWEQRKLGEVAKYRNGKAHENEIDENGKYIVVNSKFVSTDGKVRKFSKTQNEPLYENEIAFVLSDVPNGRAIAKTFLVEESNKYTLNQRIAGITPMENTYPYFLHILMNRNRYFLLFDDGAKQTNLSVTDVMEFEQYYPRLEEQIRIGIFFRNLDNLITLHQRKLEKLQNIKKAYLNEMFV